MIGDGAGLMTTMVTSDNEDLMLITATYSDLVAVVSKVKIERPILHLAIAHLIELQSG
jgi:hypothetical protein